jgi:hypothetical protein
LTNLILLLLKKKYLTFLNGIFSKNFIEYTKCEDVIFPKDFKLLLFQYRILVLEQFHDFLLYQLALDVAKITSGTQKKKLMETKKNFIQWMINISKKNQLEK